MLPLNPEIILVKVDFCEAIILFPLHSAGTSKNSDKYDTIRRVSLGFIMVVDEEIYLKYLLEKRKCVSILYFILR